jgi:single-strand DNA-binding protein
MNKSVNKVFLVGRLTRNPELRHTTTNKAVCAFGLATNRTRKMETGEKQPEEADFHRIVAWDKLAEFCDQYLRKGRMIHVEGRLQNRTYTGQDGIEKYTIEIVAEELMILDKMPDDVKESLPSRMNQMVLRCNRSNSPAIKSSIPRMIES